MTTMRKWFGYRSPSQFYTEYYIFPKGLSDFSQCYGARFQYDSVWVENEIDKLTDKGRERLLSLIKEYHKLNKGGKGRTDEEAKEHALDNHTTIYKGKKITMREWHKLTNQPT